MGLVLLLCLAASPAAGLDPTRAIDQYAMDSWGTAEGLPHRWIEAIVQTRDGYLWLATQEGLVRFDGVRFTVFNRVNTEALRDNYVETLFESRDGTLWLGVFGGGIVRMRGGVFQNLTEEIDPGQNEGAIRFAEGHDRRLWILMPRGVLIARDAAGTITRWGPEEGLPSAEGTDLLVSAAGEPWIGTGAGLVRLTGSSVRRYGAAEGLPDDRVTALYEEAPGRLWVGTRRGLALREGERFTRFGAKEGFPLSPVRTIARDRDGNLWIGTESGLVRYRDRRFQTFTSKEFLPHNTVTALLEGREGELWVGSYGDGLVRLKDGSFTTFRSRHGLASEFIYSVAPARDGGVWTGTYEGLVEHFRPERVRPLDLPKPFAERVRALHEDRSGALWIGTDQGLFLYRNGTLEDFRGRPALPSRPVRAIAEDVQGQIWIGTDGGGLARFSEGQFFSYTRKEGLAGDAIRAILPAGDGGLWIGTYSGLARFREGKFSRWTMREGLSSNLVRSLHEDTEGTLWVGTYGGGLNRFRNGRLTSYTTREGLFNDVVYQILEDSLGYLWMTCNLGIYRVFKRELEDFAEGRIKSIRSESFGGTDGMADAECNGGSPAGAILSDGTLCFPTSAGLAMVNPARLRRNDVPPPVFLEKVVSDDRQWTPQSTLRLPPGTRRVDFHYTATSFTNPSKVRFAYRLEGFDEDWVSAGTERVAHYTRLPPGNYRFRVLASNDSGLWNRTGASVAVRLKPRYYQTPLFLMVCVLGVAAGAFGLHRWRIARIRAHEQELERRVAEAVARVRRLHGLLPICSSCKKVRDDKGYWSALDQYVRERSEAEFSHGICPDCLARLYPDFTDQPQAPLREPN